MRRATESRHPGCPHLLEGSGAADVVQGAQRRDGKVVSVPVPIKDNRGDLLPSAIPKVVIAKDGRYMADDFSADPAAEIEILARIDKNLRDAPLAGFVREGMAPYGHVHETLAVALRRAILSGMPVVRVGRGNAEGITDYDTCDQPRLRVLCDDLTIKGNNLTATKARLLLMACLMKFGGLPPVADRDNPTEEELESIRAQLAKYQTVFDTH